MPIVIVMLARNEKFDLVDIYLCNINSMSLFLNIVDIVRAKVLFVLPSLKELVDPQNMNETTNGSEYMASNSFATGNITDTDSNFDNEYETISAFLKLGTHVFIRGKKLLLFFQMIDNYVFKDISLDLFIFQLKPTIALMNMSKNVVLSVEETKQYILGMIELYGVIVNLFQDFTAFSLHIEKYKQVEYLLTSFILRKNIIAKFEIENAKRNFIQYFMKPNIPISSTLMMIYSINGDNIMDKLAKIIEGLSYIKSGNFLLHNYYIKEVGLDNNMFTSSVFNSYEVVIDGKEYLIKKFDLSKTLGFPSGLSTAYLNVGNTFQSIGYMCSIDNKETFFVSVEEKTGFFFFQTIIMFLLVMIDRHYIL